MHSNPTQRDWEEQIASIEHRLTQRKHRKHIRTAKSVFFWIFVGIVFNACSYAESTSYNTDFSITLSTLGLLATIPACLLGISLLMEEET